jgi:protein-disulfide isomerase
MREVSTESTLTPPVSDEQDHMLGSPQALATLVEYGDYQCPHCGRAHYVLQELMSQAADQVRLVFRNFPLAQIHPRAEAAAEAAEAAGAQGKFWEMHDLLYENQEDLEDEAILIHADEIGLDMARFQLEWVRRDYAPRVHKDFISGVRSGVNGTPTFFINGHRHDGAWDLDSLVQAIARSITIPPKTHFGSHTQSHKH